MKVLEPRKVIHLSVNGDPLPTITLASDEGNWASTHQIIRLVVLQAHMSDDLYRVRGCTHLRNFFEGEFLGSHCCRGERTSRYLTHH